MVTCDQAEKMVMPYINDQLSDPELEDFLIHIQGCKACQDELETVFTIHMGLMQLDDNTDAGFEDISQALTESLNRSWIRVRVKKLADIICYVVDTLCFTGVTVALIMQAARWINF